MKNIIYILLAQLLTVPVNAQHTEDNIRAHYIRITSFHVTDDACKTGISEYGLKIAGMKTGELSELIQQLHNADTAVKKGLKKCTEVNDVVKRFDSLLLSQKTVDLDEKGRRRLTNAITYLKNKFAGLLLVRLHVKDDSVASIPDAVVSIQSASPAIIQRTTADSTAEYEIYIRPQADYALVIRDDGHDNYEKQLKFNKDTLLNVSLTRITGKGDSIIVPVKPSLWAYIPAVIFALLSALLFAKYRLLNRATKVQMDTLESKVDILQSKNIELADALLLKAPASTSQKSSSRYFVSEIMLTAGPRKKDGLDAHGDTELGEDVCGLITRGNTLFTWILDGTSDSYCLRNPANNKEYFSSRLLAQSIGRHFKKNIQQSTVVDMTQLVVAVTNDVRRDWIDQINKLPGDEKEVLKRNIKDGNAPFCSVTILCGTVTLDGELVMYRSGDSKMLIYTTNGTEEKVMNAALSKVNPAGNDRLFVKLAVGSDGNIDVWMNTPLFEIVREQHVTAVIGYSDGIGEQTQALLKSVYPKKPDLAREHMIYQAQGTQDDKTICMIEIKGDII